VSNVDIYNLLIIHLIIINKIEKIATEKVDIEQYQSNSGQSEMKSLKYGGFTVYEEDRRH
jgi:hypothetical protein